MLFGTGYEIVAFSAKLQEKFVINISQSCDAMRLFSQEGG
jgi:hypothetical protein